MDGFRRMSPADCIPFGGSHPCIRLTPASLDSPRRAEPWTGSAACLTTSHSADQIPVSAYVGQHSLVGWADSQRSPDEAKRNPGEWGHELPAFRFAPCGLHLCNPIFQPARVGRNHGRVPPHVCPLPIRRITSLYPPYASQLIQGGELSVTRCAPAAIV